MSSVQGTSLTNYDLAHAMFVSYFVWFCGFLAFLSLSDSVDALVCTAICNWRDRLLYFSAASHDAPYKLTSGMCNQWLHFLSAHVAWRIMILSSEMIAWKNILALTCTNPYYIHHRTHMQPPAQLGCLCSFYQATGLLLGFYYGSSRLGFLCWYC